MSNNLSNMAMEPSQKSIHSIIIDTGPLIQNAVSISTIIASAEVLYTTPAIVSEIRDAATRSRVETTLKPFLNIRSPAPASLEAVSAFAKKTGDFSLLSRQDLGILALAYEVHCEKQGGPWGLRTSPNGPLTKSPADEEKARAAAAQKQRQRRERKKLESKGEVLAEEAAVQPEAEGPQQEEQEPATPEEEWIQVGARSGGRKPTKAMPAKTQSVKPGNQSQEESVEQASSAQGNFIEQETEKQEESTEQVSEMEERSIEPPQPPEPTANVLESEPTINTIEKDLTNLQFSEPSQTTQQPTPPTSENDDSDDDWITPSNLSAHQAQDTNTQSLASQQNQVQTPVATMTTDFAMQNVLLQMNLNLLSTNMQRIRKLRTSVLRCHACFLTTKEMDKQFCPRCGGPSLTRVSCSTNANGEFKIHLSKNYQHNSRGNRYSIPKPVAGTSNGRLAGKGGGKGGWGRELVLAEDQKEFTRQIDEGKRLQTRDLMDEDYLPGILTGYRGQAGGRPKVGAGRNINSRKRF
jgi:RNA-binding protein NOB1